MNCRKVRYYQSARYDGTFPEKLRAEMEAHIRNCQRCDRERMFEDQILATAKSLPTKHVAEDFNLQLMNRIFAEQNHQTESYLPSSEPSFWRRPSTWVSPVATIGALVVLALFFMRSETSPDLNHENLIMTSVPQPANVPNAQFASIRQHKSPASAWDYIFGVAGQQSKYRATTIDKMESLHLSTAKINALWEEYVSRTEHLNKARYSPSENELAYPGYQYYRPYQRSSNIYERMAADNPRIRTAHSTWR